MRGVDYDEIHARLAERSNAVHGVMGRSDRSAYAQATAVVLRSAGEFRRFLEVLHGDHADELVFTIYHEHFFDAVLVQEE